MSGDLSNELDAFGLRKASAQVPVKAGCGSKFNGTTAFWKMVPKSSAELSGGSKGRAAEENGPRQPTEREGPTELRDLIDDVLLLVFREVAKAGGPKALCAVELSCGRFRRLGQSPAVYRGFSHLKVAVKRIADKDDWVHDRDRQLSFAPDFAPLGSNWTKVMELLLERGARPRVLELSGYWWDLPKVAAGLRTLLTDDGLFMHKAPAQMGDAVQIQLGSLECLVLSFDCFAPNAFDRDYGVLSARAGRVCHDSGVLLRPAHLPALRVLVVRCGEDGRSRQLSEDLRRVWEGTTLLCLKTPFPEHSFCRGPEEEPPHSDLLRLSQPCAWAHSRGVITWP